VGPSSGAPPTGGGAATGATPPATPADAPPAGAVSLPHPPWPDSDEDRDAEQD
jgi:hypothetical protein